MRTIPETRRRWPHAAWCLLLAASLAPAQTGNGVKLQVHADQITAHMPPTFHGLMTEDINYAYEGGLYAELIRNRNFKESVPARTNRQNPQQSTPAKETKDLAHWSLVQERGGAGSMALDTATPLNAAVPATLKLTIEKASGNQSVGVANDGFWGIPVKPNTTYKAMFYAKAAAGFTGGLTASIVSNDGATVAATASGAEDRRRLAEVRTDAEDRREREGVRGEQVRPLRQQARHGVVRVRFAVPADL